MDEKPTSVGYGRPPIHSRWPKGTSGNPAGRKKGQRNLKADLADELSKRISVTENGVHRTVTKQQALVAKLVNGSIQGDTKLSIALLRLLANLLPDNESVLEPLSSSDEAIIDELLNHLKSPLTKVE